MNQLSTGILQVKDGSLRIGLEIKKSKRDPEPFLIVLPVDLARELAFCLVEECDRIEPPLWRNTDV